MKDFAAIDFETANFNKTSVCSVGVVVVRDGKKVDSFYSLIHPEPDYYNYRCSSVNGLCREDTEEAPIFPEVWEQIEPMIEGTSTCRTQQGFRRELSQGSLPHVSDGLSRLSVLLHPHKISPSMAWRASQPRHYRRALRLRP